MPDITGGLGTGSVGTPAPERAVPLSGQFRRGRFSALTGLSASCSIGTVDSDISYAIWAASASLSDVQAAINAASPGDTVRVPAGSATWNDQLFITKGVSLIGAGIGQTLITSTYTPATYDLNNSTRYSFLFLYTPADPAANIPLRISGFDVDFDVEINGINLYLRPPGETEVAQENIRIDNNKFTGCNRFFQTNGDFWGVVYQNQLDCLRPFCTYGSDYFGWRTHTFELGTGDNMFFEDNVVTGVTRTFGASGAGGRYCIRHNDYTYVGTVNQSPCFDFHGNTAASHSSTMGAEIYENTLRLGSKSSGTVFDGRGGMAVVFNNKLLTTSTNTPGQSFREEECDNTGPNQPNNTISGQPMHVSDSYVWENRWGDGVATKLINTGTYPLLYPAEDPGGTLRVQDLGRTIPEKNYDYFAQRNGTFDGSGDDAAGGSVGVGLLSARPVSCSLEGVGYWATDTATLYRWKDGAWETYYTPYTYPHPLRGE